MNRKDFIHPLFCAIVGMVVPLQHMAYLTGDKIHWLQLILMRALASPIKPNGGLMLIDRIQIKGFRNFAKETIDLSSKTLIVGGNDTGKTNLLYALRILFDPTLSSRDFELAETDFNVQSSAENVTILAFLKDISEPCLISAFGGSLLGDRTVIGFHAKRDGAYTFYTGTDINNLNEVPSRTYIRNLQLEYVSCNRDLSAFLRRQQSTLLDIARAQRNEKQTTEDEAALKNIQSDLNVLNDSINSLHYIEDALTVVNSEMKNLAANNESYRARFVAGNTDANKLVDDLRLSYLAGDMPLTFGGEGRGNQLYFATWISEQRLKHAQEKVVIYAIEEPEAHLHPHQQRRLAEYLSGVLPEQVLLTTHSPQIVGHFHDGKILRLGLPDAGGRNIAAGCSVEIDTALDVFGYRLNSISAETFFSDGVFLVEGASERIFYTALATALGMDFDHLNLSIISVEGIGFKPYIRICKALGIPWVLRTDNDIFLKRGSQQYRAAGIQRAIGIAREAGCLDAKESKEIDLISSTFEWTGNRSASFDEHENRIRQLLRPNGIFLADIDLENDLANSPLLPDLKSYYGTTDSDELVNNMKERKAENMHDFIGSKPNLSLLVNDSLAQPLHALLQSARKLTQNV
jgi:putative ATP-dependent endonuclease of OLD family